MAGALTKFKPPRPHAMRPVPRRALLRSLLVLLLLASLALTFLSPWDQATPITDTPPWPSDTAGGRGGGGGNTNPYSESPGGDPNPLHKEKSEATHSTGVGGAAHQQSVMEERRYRRGVAPHLGLSGAEASNVKRHQLDIGGASNSRRETPDVINFHHRIDRPKIVQYLDGDAMKDRLFEAKGAEYPHFDPGRPQNPLSFDPREGRDAQEEDTLELIINNAQRYANLTRALRERGTEVTRLLAERDQMRAELAIVRRQVDAMRLNPDDADEFLSVRTGHGEQRGRGVRGSQFVEAEKLLDRDNQRIRVPRNVDGLDESLEVDSVISARSIQYPGGFDRRKIVAFPPDFKSSSVLPKAGYPNSADSRASSLDGAANGSRTHQNGTESSRLLASQLRELEIMRGGTRLNNEFEQTPFTRFSLQRLYLVEPGLGRRVVEKPIGHKKRDILEVVDLALRRLNDVTAGGRVTSSDAQGKHQRGFSQTAMNNDVGQSRLVNENFYDVINVPGTERSQKANVAFTSDDFLEGIYRTIPGIGTQYELYFSDRVSGYRRVVVVRPFGAPSVIAQGAVPMRRETINLILPLSGRVEAFRQFVERFIEVCVAGDKKVFLTVVYFGTEGLDEIRAICRQMSDTFGYHQVSVLSLEGEFSRGRALQAGAHHWPPHRPSPPPSFHSTSRQYSTRPPASPRRPPSPRGAPLVTSDIDDVLMFFCDVDVVFTTDFLERCRLNTEQGRRVYYPVVFSLYNPRVVQAMAGGQDPLPPHAGNSDTAGGDGGQEGGSQGPQRWVISKDTGFWRDFGYGMTCQYRSDFLRMEGFDETLQGWGLEDVQLYRQYVRSAAVHVVRATDPGIFHPWHAKRCAPRLAPDQYRGCMRSRALNEASHAQLGMLAFREEFELHRNITRGGGAGAEGGA